MSRKILFITVYTYNLYLCSSFIVFFLYTVRLYIYKVGNFRIETACSLKTERLWKLLIFLKFKVVYSLRYVTKRLQIGQYAFTGSFFLYFIFYGIVQYVSYVVKYVVDLRVVLTR